MLEVADIREPLELHVLKEQRLEYFLKSFADERETEVFRCKTIASAVCGD